MREFSDENGQKWRVELTKTEFELVKGALGVDLTDIFADKHLLNQLRDNDVLMVNVLFVICESQAKELGVSQEDFGRHLYGDAIDRAESAFWDALLDFFPRRRREALAAAMEARKKIEEARSDMLSEVKSDKMVERIIDEDKRRLRHEIERYEKNGSDSDHVPERSGGTTGPSQGSSGSILAN